MHKYAMKLIQQHDGKIQIYTDGSVRGNPRRKGGAGYSIKNSDNEEPLTGKMSIETNSIAIDEMTAIINALSQVSTAEQKDIVVFSDNKYNIIHNCNNKHLHLAKKLHQYILHINHCVTLTIDWLPAHCNISLHDKAHELAIEADDAEHTVYYYYY